MFAQLQELDRVPEIERGVRTRSAYVPPASNEITTSQVEKLVKVQALVRQRLGQRFTELEVKYKALMDKKDATVVDLPALLGAYRDVAAAWMEAKRSQVDALNAVDLSLDEYKWIREQCYRALGAPYMDFDVAKIVEQIRGGATNMSNPPGQIRVRSGPPVRKRIERSSSHSRSSSRTTYRSRRSACSTLQGFECGPKCE